MNKVLELLKEAVKILEAVPEGTANCGKEKLADLWPGTEFKVGEHTFIVLEHTENGTCVISKGFMAKDVVFDENSRDYNVSSLKKLIEEDIQPIIERVVGSENLVEHSVELTSVDMQSEFCWVSGCKVRPITFDEARKYNQLIVNKELNGWWWTLTPWSTAERGWSSSIAVVSPSGIIYNRNHRNGSGVRPFCILKSDIFVSLEGNR